jgi:hypothetical protein
VSDRDNVAYLAGALTTLGAVSLGLVPGFLLFGEEYEPLRTIYVVILLIFGVLFLVWGKVLVLSLQGGARSGFLSREDRP